MKSYQELIQQSISAVVQKMHHPERKGWVKLPDDKLKENMIHVSTVNAFLKRYQKAAKLLENLAQLIISTKTVDDKFTETSNALRELHLKSKAIVYVSLHQENLAHSVLEKLWTNDLYLAAGRIMRAATLGIDSNPIDLAMVNEAERRGPLLLEYANHIWLGISSSDLTTDAVKEAMDNVPAHELILWEEFRHPLEGKDDSTSIYLKNYVSEKLWTTDVLIAAGRIAAIRSLSFSPPWSDVEMVYKADYLSRWTVANAKQIISEHIKNDEEVFPKCVVEKTLSQLEKNYHQPDTSEDAVLKEMHKKICQHVWTSRPDYVRAKAAFEKHGPYYTAHGDMMKLQAAQAFEMDLFDNMMPLLIKKEEKLLNKSQSSFITWLWGNKMGDSDKVYLTPNDVSHQLVEKATKMVDMNRNRT